MITGFEKITQELTDYEKEKLLPLLIQGLAGKIGKENAITNPEMCRKLKEHGYKTSPPRIRKMISYIRLNGDIPCLMATSIGYYISYDKQELRDYVDSLWQRVDSIAAIAKQMEFQLKAL